MAARISKQNCVPSEEIIIAVNNGKDAITKPSRHAVTA
jgi:hypothetical protein